MVGAHGAFELLDLQDLVGDLDLHVLLDLDLAGEAVAFLGLLLGDVAGLGGQDVAAALEHLALAHGAGAAAAAGGGQEDVLLGQGGEQGRAGRDFEDLRCRR